MPSVWWSIAVRAAPRRAAPWLLVALVAPLLGAECGVDKSCGEGQFEYQCVCTHGPPLPIAGAKTKRVNSAQCETSKEGAVSAASGYAQDKKGEESWACSCEGPDASLVVDTEETPAPGCAGCGETVSAGADPALLCESSGAVYDLLVACLCDAGPCAADCNATACASLPASTACDTCMRQACNTQYNGCLAD